MFREFVVRLAAAAACGLAALIAPTAASAAAVEGTWRTLNGSEITIAPCGADEYCGSLSYIVIPREQADICRSMEKQSFASLMLDYNNADKAMQTRPLLGVEMVRLRPNGEPEGYTATIYNAQDGKSYEVLVWIMNGDTLRLGGGCVQSMCAVTQDWPRVAARETAPDFTCEGGQ
jgi:uncharacterized protein (DUF2147 family)